MQDDWTDNYPETYREHVVWPSHRLTTLTVTLPAGAPQFVP